MLITDKNGTKSVDLSTIGEDINRETTVAILGPAGTWSEIALKHYMGTNHVGESYRCVYANNIQALIADVHNEEIDYVFCPIENSQEGDVLATLDNLVAVDDVYITGEFIMPICQCLIAGEGVERAGVKTIYSHPQAIGQCVDYLTENLPDVAVVHTSSTAAAAAMVAKSIESGNNSVATIGSRDLAEQYNLKVLDENVQDGKDNVTRFVTIARDAKPDGGDRTSLMFVCDDKAGELYKMLSIFNIFDVNMIQLRSRPTKTVLGEYMFFVDIVGDAKDEGIAKALECLEMKAKRFKNLGSYDKG
ncbi:MAG: prephenate dehydratase [Clostridiales bacterium]|jgi:prephenate dehydratase|nr:prephenate dehydratase [Clostridiales bacterium]